jgi:hypothetical protein
MAIWQSLPLELRVSPTTILAAAIEHGMLLILGDSK